MHRTMMAAGLAMMTLWGASAGAQPIASFAEVAGTWSGRGSRGGKTDLNLESTGRFVIESPLGKQSGMGRLDGGVLVLRWSNNQGQLELTRTGEVLEGPYVVGTLTGTTRLSRLGR